MTRRRARRPDAARPGLADPGSQDLATHLALSPSALARELDAADSASRTRALDDLQAGAGNAAVGGLLSGHGHATGSGMGRGASPAGVRTRTTDLTISRDIGDDDIADVSDLVVPLGAGATTGAIETVGPVTASSYAVDGSSLADVAAFIGGRDEAGHVSWGPTLDFHQTDGVIDSVTIDVSIDLEMPAWSPPSSMLPRARAEWSRWYAALQAHEQGHIDLVHQAFDGLASRILGKQVATGRRLFATARSTLATASRAYDGRTGHGTRQGTIMNVAIEQQEADEARRDRERAEQGRKRQGAVPDVGDEAGD
jgi:predicted secreted Zn-dependent protease